MQALPTTPESLVVVEMDPSVSASAPSTGNYQLHFHYLACYFYLLFI